MWRDIYRLTLTPELFLDEDNLRDLIRQTDGHRSMRCLRDVTETIDSLADYLAECARRDEMALHATLEAVAHREHIDSTARSLFAHSAPMASSLGRWLQGLSCPGNFEDEMQLKTLALLADDIGVGKAERSRTDGFRQIARGVGLPEAAGQPHELVADRTLRDGAFRFPALLYALSRRSDAFIPEIAGLDFALRTIGLLPVWRVLSMYIDDTGWSRLDLAVPQTDALPSAIRRSRCRATFSTATIRTPTIARGSRTE